MLYVYFCIFVMYSFKDGITRLLINSILLHVKEVAVSNKI